MTPGRDATLCRSLFGPVVKASDCYWTPVATTEALLAHDAPPAGCTVLDPGAGTGSILRVLAMHGYRVEALELRPEEEPGLREFCSRVTIADWLTYAWRYSPRPNAIVMNPPFSIAPAFVGVSLGLDVPYVAALLRCNTLGSNTWRRLWAEHPPTRLRPVRRPSFSGDGHTDASEYPWMIWIRGEKPLDIKPV